MSRSLPSLTALRVFDVAGRLQSFSNAAVELNITQGAVSRQIRALEEELQVRLFTRLTRRVVLTDEGQQYLAEVRAALDRIEQATTRVRRGQNRQMLTISVLPSIGSFWLMPRLARFSQRHPEVETRIISSIDPVNLHLRDADVAIRVGALPGRRYSPPVARVDLSMVSNWRGVLADELAPDILVPVGLPSCLPDEEAWSDPARIRALPLIHTASRPHAWPDWIRAYGLPPLGSAHKIEYGHFFMSLEAARAGEGIAIVPDVILAGAAINGLKAAWSCPARSAGEYYLLSLSERAQEHAIQAFREWVQEEMRNTTLRS